jgi:hypothetical protein
MQVAVYNFKFYNLKYCVEAIVGKRVPEKRCPRKGGEKRWWGKAV